MCDFSAIMAVIRAYISQDYKVNGLSQEQLAEKLNVSRQAISKWEMGAIPDMDNVIKISRFFDCSLD